MLTLGAYVRREVLRAFLGVFVVLVVIYLASRIVDYLADAAAGDLERGLILRLVLLKLLTAFTTLLPLCFYLGTFLALTRLARENELVAMRGIGLGQRFLLGTVLRLALLLAIPLEVSALFLSPWAERQMAALESEARERSEVTGISAGRFRELGGGERVVYVEDLSEADERMRQVFIHSEENGRTGVLSAREGRLVRDPDTGERWIEFASGSRYEGAPGDRDYAVTHFGRYTVRLDAVSAGGAGEGRLNAAGLGELWRGEGGRHAAELHWRLMPGIATLLLAVLAVALQPERRSATRQVGLVQAILAYFLYSNLLGVARSLLKKDAAPVWLGLWWVHLALALVLAAVFLWPVWRARRLARRAAVLV